MCKKNYTSPPRGIYLGTQSWLNVQKSINTIHHGASFIAQLVKNPPGMQDPRWSPGSRRCPGEGIGYPLQYSWACLVAQLVKKSACNVGDLASIPGLRRSPEEGKGYQFQYSGLENSMGCIVHGVAKSWTRLRDFHFT